MYIHVIFVLFKVKELPDEEKFSVTDSVSYFSKLFYCLKTNSKYLKSDESFENWHNTVREFFEYLKNPVGRDYREPEQFSRAIFWRTGTIDSNEIFENRDNPVGRDFREPGQPSRTKLSSTLTIQSGDILEKRNNRFEQDFREPGQSCLTRFSRSGKIQDTNEIQYSYEDKTKVKTIHPS